MPAYDPNLDDPIVPGYQPIIRDEIVDGMLIQRELRMEQQLYDDMDADINDKE